MRILIVDDEPNIRRTLRVALEAMGHAVEEAATAAEALGLVERQPFDVALIDLRLGGESGLDLLEPAAGPVAPPGGRRHHGARQRSTRPSRRCAAAPSTTCPSRSPPPRSAPSWSGWPGSGACATGSPTWRSGSGPRSPRPTWRAATPRSDGSSTWPGGSPPTDAAVLIRGESGTGKGVLARALHAWSRRADGPFVTVSCPSLSAELLESDLFGHVRGAFTGAVRDAAGKVAAAEGGTLFLDEVGDLPPPLQPKLLRFLQERRYERVGEAKTRAADVRLVAATNRDLEAAVAAGTFREDLLYRLNVVELTLPPLRRRSDVLDLADHLLGFFARQTGRRLTGFTPEAREALARHAWPGNLRELRNAIERAAILADGPEVGLADLPERIASARTGTSPTAAVEVGGPVSLERLEVEHIRRVLAAAPSREEAARILGIDPSTLYRKRKQFGL